MGFLGQELRNSIKTGGSLSIYDDFWYGITGGPTKAGVTVTEETALKYLALFSCVSLISGDIAGLPLGLNKKLTNGDTEHLTGERLHDVVHNEPNKNTSSFNYREAGSNHLLTWGNTYSEIKRVPRTGEISELIQLPKPGIVEVKSNRKGIYYQWNDPKTGKKIRKAKRDILHIPGWSMNGLIGMSLIAIARESIGLGIAAGEFGSLYFGQGLHPSGVFETDKNLGDNRKDYIDSVNQQYGGLGKSHKAMVLEMGLKYSKIDIPMDDAQFLQTREAQKLDICGMYKVPPHKIGIHGANSNNNNLEQENGSYVSQCLMSWINRWEQNLNIQLLTQEQRMSGWFFKFNLNALLRGDSQARAEYYQTMFNTGAYSPNKILSKEDENGIGEQGDQHFVDLNKIPLDQAADFGKQNTDPEQNNLRMIEHRAKNSITLRDRIAKRFYPLLKKAGQDIVDRESIAVKRQVKKQQRGRENRDMQSWLDSFYRKFHDEIKSKIGPVIRAYSEAISDASIKEMGIDDDITKELDSFVNDYIDTYAERHTQSSLGQLTQQLDDSLDAVTLRVDEWEEKRSKKIADDEIVRNSSAVYQFVAFGAGLSTVWRIRGKTCPYCTSLSGKRVSSGQSFVNPGDEIDPEGGTGPMKFSGIKRHPPLHQKCLPGNANVTAFGITASSEDWFDGNMFVIHTASGNKITCTPNHPILTCHGWVNADKINVGNQVRKGVFTDWDIPVIGNSKNMEPLIKDVAKSFIDPGKMIAVPVPTTSKDFNNDFQFADGKITIIRTDGSLLLERDPGLFHELREFNLSLRNLSQIVLTSNSSFAEFVKARLPSQCRSMSGRDLLSSLSGGHTLPIEQTGFALPTKFDPVNSKILIYNHTGNPETVGNGIDGFPVEVLADEVVRIENNSFHGLVYNLHTKDNLFYTENIVVHNCDCYLSVV